MKFKNIVLCCTFILMLLAGSLIFFGRERLYGFYKTIFHSQAFSRETQDQISSYVPDRLSKIKKPDDISKLRQQLIQYIFKRPALDKMSRPFQVNKVDDSPYPLRLKNKAEIYRIISRMKHGLETRAFYYVFANSHCLLIYHQGHGSELLNSQHGGQEKQLLQEAGNNGCDLLVHAMPLHNPNQKFLVNDDNFGPLTISRHDHLALLESDDFSPISYFLQPLLESLNYVLAQHSYKHVVMTGLSGGGWTTTLYAALDTRIQDSIEVSGSYPVVLRLQDRGSWGDWEQNNPRLYNIADYPDLYLLSSLPQRHHVQILREKDTCCFPAEGAVYYADRVARRSQALDGRYDYYSVNDVAGHQISKDTAAIILSIARSSSK